MPQSNFEDKMKQLEDIVNTLEKGNMNLNESLDKFEEGMKLSKKCSEILDNAEKKIKILINNGDVISEADFKGEDYE